MKIQKLEDKFEQEIQDGIDLDNCGKMQLIEDNDEYYVLHIELSSGEKMAVDIWKDEMTADEVLSKFIGLCTKLSGFLE